VDSPTARPAPHGALNHVPPPAGAPAAHARVTLREIPRACVQFSGFGSGRDLAQWLRAEVGVAPAPNTVAAVLDGAACLAAIGPATWLMTGAPGALDAIFAAGRETARPCAAVTDFSEGGRAFLELRGEPVAAVLGKYIDIDFDGGGLEPGHCASTAIHDTAVLVMRHRSDLFEIAVHRSFASSLAQTLLDAAAEFGATIGGTGQ